MAAWPTTVKELDALRTRLRRQSAALQTLWILLETSPLPFALAVAPYGTKETKNADGKTTVQVTGLFSKDVCETALIENADKIAELTALRTGLAAAERMARMHAANATAKEAAE